MITNFACKDLLSFSFKSHRMTFDQFVDSLDHKFPPDLNNALLALWYDGKDNWQQAHEIAQDIDDEFGSAIHAYLHRKEQDFGNASYWYMRANRTPVRHTLQQEWQDLVKEALGFPGKR